MHLAFSIFPHRFTCFDFGGPWPLCGFKNYNLLSISLFEWFLSTVVEQIKKKDNLDLRSKFAGNNNGMITNGAASQQAMLQMCFRD